MGQFVFRHLNKAGFYMYVDARVFILEVSDSLSFQQIRLMMPSEMEPKSVVAARNCSDEYI